MSSPKSEKISVSPIKTPVFHSGNDLNQFLAAALKDVVLEGRVIALTSKVVSLAEKQLVPFAGTNKFDLIQRESDVYLGPGGFGCELTIKHGILIPSAGIDESNSETGDYILFPKDPFKSAENIWKHLTSTFRLKNLGVIITDSHTTPLRRGVTGIGLSYWGFKATRSLVDHPDIFGRPLKFTHVNVLDSLAAMAVFMMGESDDQTPLAVIEGAKVEFNEKIDPKEIVMPLGDDIYSVLFENILKLAPIPVPK